MSLSQKLPESVFIFGCGYVGTALAEYLIEQGVRVGALTRNREKAARLRELGVAEVIEAELDSSTWHAQVRGQYEAVVNCVSSAGGGSTATGSLTSTASARFSNGQSRRRSGLMFIPVAPQSIRRMAV